MSGLTIFLGAVFRFELDSSFFHSEVMIVCIDEVCFELGEFYGLKKIFGGSLQCNPMNL